MCVIMCVLMCVCLHIIRSNLKLLFPVMLLFMTSVTDFGMQNSDRKCYNYWMKMFQPSEICVQKCMCQLFPSFSVKYIAITTFLTEDFHFRAQKEWKIRYFFPAYVPVCVLCIYAWMYVREGGKIYHTSQKIHAKPPKNWRNKGTSCYILKVFNA